MKLVGFNRRDTGKELLINHLAENLDFSVFRSSETDKEKLLQCEKEKRDIETEMKMQQKDQLRELL